MNKPYNLINKNNNLQNYKETLEIKKKENDSFKTKHLNNGEMGAINKREIQLGIAEITDRI